MIAANQLWWTLALAPVLLLPGYVPQWLHLTAIALMAVPWALRAFDRSAPRYPAFDLLLLIFLLWHLPSFYATVDTTVSLEKFSQNLVGIGLASGLLSKHRSTTDIRRLVLLAVVGTGLVATVTPFVTQWSWPSKLAQVIPAGLLHFRFLTLGEDVNANILGGLMVLMLPVAIGLLAGPNQEFSSWPKTTRAAALLATLAIVSMLVLSQARGGYLGTAAGLLLLAYLAGGRWRWGVAAALYGALAIVLWVGPSRFKDVIGASGSLINSWEVRSELWNRATYMIQDFSFTGVGLGMYGKVANILYPFFLISPDVQIGHAHQLLLQVAVDLGIPGLVIYCAILGYGVSRPGLHRPDGLRLLHAGLLCGLAAMLVHGLMDCPLWSSKLAPAPWLVLGTLVWLQGDGPGVRKSYLRRWEVAVWWVLISLLAISLVGNHATWAILLAIAAGFTLGLLA